MRNRESYPPAALLLLAVLLLTSGAAAHDRKEQRRAIVTVYTTPQGLTADVLLLRELPPGPRAASLLARFDVDRSGDLSPLEAQLLANELGPDTVGGYVLRANGQAPTPASLQTSASATDPGGLAIALLLSYPLPTTCAPGACRVAVQVLATPGGGAPLLAAPLTVELQLARPLTLSSSSTPPASDAPVVGAVALPGEEGVWVEIGVPAP